LKAKKSLGQNFLVDKGAIMRIMDVVSPADDEIVIEVGPGRGALTRYLIERSGIVLAIELDREMVELLRTELASERLTIIEGDILQVDIPGLIHSTLQTNRQLQPRARAVANLPYYISTAVITQFIEARSVLKDMTLMLQREVAERITSPPGSRDYGALSVLVQLYCRTQRLFHVAPGSFRPIPKVDSTVVRLELYDSTSLAVGDEALLNRVVRSAFAQRRKTILNSLKAMASNIDPRLKPDQIQQILESASIAPQRRAETLSPPEYVRLTDQFFSAIKDQ
jgi:16S rRNA (adenine1518-N6/adenine1519-N6)-dimethyltransferase